MQSDSPEDAERHSPHVFPMTKTKTLQTWAGNAEFNYYGSVAAGTIIPIYNYQRVIISASHYESLLDHFRDTRSTLARPSILLEEVWGSGSGLTRQRQKNKRDKILVQFKSLSSTNAGIATTRLSDSTYKMRIVIHDKLDDRSRYSVICHELAHIYLGHLGTDKDNWWPCRINLTHSTVEIEAEAVSYIVTLRVGLKSPSDSFLIASCLFPNSSSLLATETIHNCFS